MMIGQALSWITQSFYTLIRGTKLHFKLRTQRISRELLRWPAMQPIQRTPRRLSRLCGRTAYSPWMCNRRMPVSVSDWAGVVGVIVSIAGLLGALMGWLLRQLWEAVRNLVVDIADLQKSLPGTYVRKDEMQKMEDHILAEIRAVSHTLERHMENSTQLWVNSQRD